MATSIYLHFQKQNCGYLQFRNYFLLVDLFESGNKRHSTETQKSTSIDALYYLSEIAWTFCPLAGMANLYLKNCLKNRKDGAGNRLDELTLRDINLMLLLNQKRTNGNLTSAVFRA